MKFILIYLFFLKILQDLLFLACSHHENRNSLTQMEEWPEWILEVLISNYEVISCPLCLSHPPPCKLAFFEIFIILMKFMYRVKVLLPCWWLKFNETHTHIYVCVCVCNEVLDVSLV